MDEKWEAIESYLSAYSEVTEVIEKKIKRHIKRYNLPMQVCAWYADWEDFCSDWCDGLGYSREEAKNLLHGGVGEFMTIKDFGILRFVI